MALAFLTHPNHIELQATATAKGLRFYSCKLALIVDGFEASQSQWEFLIRWDKGSSCWFRVLLTENLMRGSSSLSLHSLSSNESGVSIRCDFVWCWRFLIRTFTNNRFIERSWLQKLIWRRTLLNKNLLSKLLPKQRLAKLYVDLNRFHSGFHLWAAHSWVHGKASWQALLWWKTLCPKHHRLATAMLSKF